MHMLSGEWHGGGWIGPILAQVAEQAGSAAEWLALGVGLLGLVGVALSAVIARSRRRVAPVKVRKQ
jgi:predicted MFS family arabinose efflux permease